MPTLAKALTGLAALAFVLAVVTNFTAAPYVSAEGFSRAAENLALLALALVFCVRDGSRP